MYSCIAYITLLSLHLSVKYRHRIRPSSWIFEIRNFWRGRILRLCRCSSCLLYRKRNFIKNRTIFHWNMATSIAIFKMAIARQF